MKKYLKIVGLGILTWLVPFVASWPFYSRDGQPLVDIFLIKSIMIVVFSAFGMLLLVVYFRKIDRNFVREGFIVGSVWFIINCILDMTILVPMAGMSVPTWFAHIGMRYLTMITMGVALGYMAGYHRK
jgi:hypothetical protein